MEEKRVVVRCYGEKNDGQWTIVCLDFCLAAQADTFNEARVRLDAQIVSYLRDALVGPDRAHARYLLSRRAPASMWAKYYYAKALTMLLQLLGNKHGRPGQRPFRETIPNIPAHC